MNNLTIEDRAQRIIQSLMSPTETLSFKDEVLDCRVTSAMAEKAICDEIHSHVRELTEERHKILALAVSLAISTQCNAGIGRESDEVEGPADEKMFVVVDLPTGSVKWHIHDRYVYMFNHLQPYVGGADENV